MFIIVSITCLKIIMETLFSNMKKNPLEDWHYFRLLQVSFMSGSVWFCVPSIIVWFWGLKSMKKSWPATNLSLGKGVFPQPSR